MVELLSAGRRSRHRRISSLDEKMERRSMVDPALMSPASSGELSVSRAKVSWMSYVCMGKRRGGGGQSGAKAAMGCTSCHHTQAKFFVVSSPIISYKLFPALYLCHLPSVFYCLLCCLANVTEQRWLFCFGVRARASIAMHPSPSSAVAFACCIL